MSLLTLHVCAIGSYLWRIWTAEELVFLSPIPGVYNPCLWPFLFFPPFDLHFVFSRHVEDADKSLTTLGADHSGKTYLLEKELLTWFWQKSAHGCLDQGFKVNTKVHISCLCSGDCAQWIIALRHILTSIREQTISQVNVNIFNKCGTNIYLFLL